MKKLILATVLAVSLCFSAYILSYNPEPKNLIERIESVEADMVILLKAVEITVGNVARLETRFEVNNGNIKERLAELKELIEREYSYIIPIDGGFLGIRED